MGRLVVVEVVVVVERFAGRLPMRSSISSIFPGSLRDTKGYYKTVHVGDGQVWELVKAVRETLGMVELPNMWASRARSGAATTEPPRLREADEPSRLWLPPPRAGAARSTQDDSANVADAEQGSRAGRVFLDHA